MTGVAVEPGCIADVVVPTLDGRDLLADCLAALRQQTVRDFGVIVVHNGSRDGTEELVRTRHPEVRYVRLDANLGFSVAVNRGIELSAAPMIALLNNDTLPAPDWLESLVRALREIPEAGFVTSKVLRHDRSDYIDNAGDGMGRKGISYPIGYLERDEGQYDARREVFAACGAACLFRRELFERVGGFDEDFFAYHEDADLGFRAQLAGFAGTFVPDAVVRHVGSATSGGRINDFTVRLSTRNNLHVLLKNLPVSLFVRYAPRLLWGQAYWFLKMAIKEGHFDAWLRGLLESLRGCERMGVKRRRVLASRAIAVAELDRRIRASEREIRSSIARKRRRGGAVG